MCVRPVPYLWEGGWNPGVGGSFPTVYPFILVRVAPTPMSFLLTLRRTRGREGGGDAPLSLPDLILQWLET